ncbi:unnamed protein product [Lactuca virosa]|uniref:Uncharacterized protein n=1 Tax=Lactuca virosa TaxID=75947 RepID=A0AAU9PQL5_9ASTR|nr:unnamed protein product [Lactuca virosa]
MEANTIPAPVNKQQSSKVSDIISENKEDVSAEEVDEEVDDAYQEGVDEGELPPLDNSDPLPEVANEGTQVRRSERVRAPSTRYPTSNYILLTSEGEPESFQEAQSHIDKANWQKAMEEEMNSLQKNQTYELKSFPTPTHATVRAVSTDYSKMAVMNSIRIDAAKMTSINDIASRILDEKLNTSSIWILFTMIFTRCSCLRSHQSTRSDTRLYPSGTLNLQFYKKGVIFDFACDCISAKMKDILEPKTHEEGAKDATKWQECC